MEGLEQTTKIKVVTDKIERNLVFSNSVNQHLNEGYKLKEVKTTEDDYLYALLVKV